MPTHQTPAPVAHRDDPIAITAMILGVVSLTGLGLITGIPAIILASVALARKSPSRNFSIVGLVTGIVSTLVSLVVVALIVLFVIIAASEGNISAPMTPVPSHTEPYSHTRV